MGAALERAKMFSQEDEKDVCTVLSSNIYCVAQSESDD